MSKIIILVSILALGACANLDTARTTVAVKGAEVSDQVLADAHWATCYAASVGAVRRLYGQTVDRAATYKDFCQGDGNANVIAPE